MSQLSLSILDVGHGNCAILIDRNGVVVIDAGPGTTLLEFLKQEAIERIDVLLISHADKDHIAGLISVIESEEFALGKVRLNSDAFKTSKLWDDVLFLLNKAHNAEEIDFDVALTTHNSNEFNQGDISIEILAPSLYIAGKGPGSEDRNGRRLTPNSVSAVIRLTKDGTPFVLLPGDIDEIGFDNLLEDSRDPTAPIAVFPHHGGRPGTGDMVMFTRRFCEKVNPRTIIFSIGRGHHGTPQPEIVAAARERIPDVRVACTQLSEHCSATVPDHEPVHLTNQFARGKMHHKCCAGTVVIPFQDTGLTVLPPSDGHQAFIRSQASTALCSRPGSS